MSKVPAGYKQTEVGVIPEDWDVLSIGDVQPFITSGSRGWAEFYSEYGAPFIRITNLIRDSIYLDLNDLRYVNLPTNNSEGVRTQLQHGDVLVSITADIGIVGYVSMNVPRPSYINQHIALVRFDSSKTDPKFVSYYLASEKPQRLFRSLTDSGAKAGMNLTTVKHIKLALPPTKTEQEAIAEALSDTDGLIESLEQLIAKKRYLKQGAMQELFTGKKRLPGFSGEWEVKRLGELFEITSSKRVFQSEWTTRGIPFYRARELAVLGEQGSVDNELFITKELYASCKKAYGVPAIGDILVTGVGTLGKVYAVEEEREFYFKDGNIIWFKSAGKISSKFLKQLYSTPRIIKQIEDRAEGTTVGTYTITNAKNTIIPFPPQPEQTAIAAILSAMDTEIAALETKLAKTRQIKQGMMHNLLTGRIRLLDPIIVKAEQDAPLGKENATLPKPEKPHNWAFNEAVVISVLADQFGKPEFPLGRKRYTKLSYLMHRKTEQEAQGYLKKAAGPYNPKTKYAGPEKIAKENGYAREHENGKFRGFIAAENIEHARIYFAKRYGSPITAWLEQFRYKSNDDLERLATVDMAMQELLKQGKTVDVDSIRALIASEPEWLPKLERSVFSNSGIAAALAECHALFAR